MTIEELVVLLRGTDKYDPIIDPDRPESVSVDKNTVSIRGRDDSSGFAEDLLITLVDHPEVFGTQFFLLSWKDPGKGVEDWETMTFIDFKAMHTWIYEL